MTTKRLFLIGMTGTIIGMLSLSSDNYSLGILVLSASALLLILSNIMVFRQLSDKSK